MYLVRIPPLCLLHVSNRYVPVRTPGTYMKSSCLPTQESLEVTRIARQSRRRAKGFFPRGTHHPPLPPTTAAAGSAVGAPQRCSHHKIVFFLDCNLCPGLEGTSLFCLRASNSYHNCKLQTANRK